MPLLWIIFLIFAIPMALVSANSILFKKKMFNREKINPFECGFDPKNLARNSFSMKFYLIGILFLVFDIEIALMIPIPLILMFNDFYTINKMILMFLAILIFGLMYEWKAGAIKWFS